MKKFLKKIKKQLMKPKKALRKVHKRSVKTLRRKIQTWIIVLVCMAIAAPIGLGAYWVFSNSLSVTPRDFTLVLEVSDDSPLRYSNVTFTATLTLAGQPTSAATIYLDRDGVEIAQAVTGIDGQCDFIINITDAANFQARFQAGL